MAVEVVAGILAHSLALLSDAAHMLTDAGALALALVALRLAARPAKGAMTYGLKRTEILSAQFNGATLLVLGLLIVYEGIRRLIDPPEVEGGVVLVVALVGVAVNLVATVVLHGADRTSLNVEGAFQHVLTDLVAFIATAIAGLVILLTGFDRADGDRLAVRRRGDAARGVGAAARLAAGSSSRRRREGIDVPRAGRRDGRRRRASPRSTTCTSGRSPRASRRCRRTCSWAPTTTATARGWTLEARAARPTSGSSTRRCRSTTRAETSSRSRSATELVLRPLQQRVEQQLVRAVDCAAVLHADAEHRHLPSPYLTSATAVWPAITFSPSSQPLRRTFDVGYVTGVVTPVAPALTENAGLPSE